VRTRILAVGKALRVLPEGLRLLGGDDVPLLIDHQVAALGMGVDAGLEGLEKVHDRDR